MDACALSASWQAVMGDQFDLPYMQALRRFLRAEKDAGKVLYPTEAETFNAFNQTDM